MVSTPLVWTLVAFPHLFYAFVWFQPHLFRALAGPCRPVQVFAAVASVLKLVQGLAVAAWLLEKSPVPWKKWPERISALQWCGFALLVGVGQALNVSLYRAIGMRGVYYGTKLGEEVPWHDGYPFTIVAHPQYVGSVLTLWGGYLLLARVAPPGACLLLAFWSSLYLLTALSEAYFP